MENILIDVAKEGVLAIVVMFLLTKGVNALNQLTHSVNELTKTVEKISGVGERLTKIEIILERMIKK